MLDRQIAGSTICADLTVRRYAGGPEQATTERVGRYLNVLDEVGYLTPA